MVPLPRGILFDLDDTILAYGRRDLLLLEIVEEFAPILTQFSATEVAATIEEHFRAYWVNAARNKGWQVPLRETRRNIVRDAFEKIGARGVRDVPLALADDMADRFHAVREERMTFFPRRC